MFLFLKTTSYLIFSIIECLIICTHWESPATSTCNHTTSTNLKPCIKQNKTEKNYTTDSFFAINRIRFYKTTTTTTKQTKNQHNKQFTHTHKRLLSCPCMSIFHQPPPGSAKFFWHQKIAFFIKRLFFSLFLLKREKVKTETWYKEKKHEKQTNKQTNKQHQSGRKKFTSV